MERCETARNALLGCELWHDPRMDTGSPAFARLLSQARDMAASSTHPAAATLDVEQWLGNWLRVPQPALGGRRPEELLDTPAGVDAVARVLGAISSGAFV